MFIVEVAFTQNNRFDDCRIIERDLAYAGEDPAEAIKIRNQYLNDTDYLGARIHCEGDWAISYNLHKTDAAANIKPQTSYLEDELPF